MQAMLGQAASEPPFYLQRSTNAAPLLPHGAALSQQFTHSTDASTGVSMGVSVSHQPSASTSKPTKSESRRAPPSQDRPFACPVPECGGRFHRKFTLHEHMKTHTGEQPHQCPVANCGKRFSTSGNLARHRKLHSLRKIACPAAHCTRVFTSREKLVPHLKVHLARTPHTCEFPGCGKTFSTAGNLTRHRRTQHRVSSQPRADAVVRPKVELPSARMLQPGNGPISMKGLLWHTGVGAMPASQVSTSATLATTTSSSRPDCRILEQDVQDLFDCLFVEGGANPNANVHPSMNPNMHQGAHVHPHAGAHVSNHSTGNPLPMMSTVRELVKSESTSESKPFKSYAVDATTYQF